MPFLIVILLLLCIPFATAGSPEELVKAARAQIGVTTQYDPAYRRLAFPGGDVASDRGVCTDVVIRAYRRLGIDLQELVHRDMRAAWSKYPKHWGLKSTDPNIDHRRVPNLEVFFRPHGSALLLSEVAADYKPGDIVTWEIPPRLPHIGIVADERSAAGVPLVIHNIGAGTQIDDVLFAFRMVGHYRYLPRWRGFQRRATGQRRARKKNAAVARGRQRPNPQPS